MKFIMMSGHGLCFPMAKRDGYLPVCPTPRVSDELEVSSNSLLMIARRNEDRFKDGLSTTLCGAKEFFQEHRKAFRLDRLRDDIHLWHTREIARFALLSHSKRAIDVQEVMIDLLLDDMKTEYVSKERFDRVLSELASLRDEVQAERHFREEAASAAGTILRDHRDFVQ